MSSKTTNPRRSSQGSNADAGNTTKGEKDDSKGEKDDKASAPSAWSNPAPNAWSRPLKTRPPPGLAPPGTGEPQNGADGPAAVMRERFLHLTLSLVGQRVTLTHTDGTVLEGVFHTATPFADLPEDKKNQFVLKAVQLINGDSDKIQNGSTVVVPADKVTSLHCKSLRLGTVNGKGEGFRTDTEIASTQNDKGRDLVAAGSAWTTGGTSGNVSRSVALMVEPVPRKNPAGLRGNIGEWDQFRANEELFDVHAKFDENLYTTELDKSALATGKIRQAERLAREIEKTTSSNIHVAEERNQAIPGDFDEEDRYSGVLTEKLQARNKDSAPQKKTMNYAAAAAKADSAKLAPPGFTGGKKEDDKSKDETAKKDQGETKNDGVEELKKESMAEAKKTSEEAGKQEEKKTTDAEQSQPSAEEEKTDAPDSKKETEASKTEDGKEESKETPESSEESKKKAVPKLNANAKSFTFNPGAKTFTPSFGSPAPAAPAPPQVPQMMVDPNTGAPLQPHYMHPMGHPGMMHMMNPQFAAMRYPGGYPGMEQPLPPGQKPPQPQHIQQPQEGQPAASGGDEHQQTGESATPGAQQAQQQQPVDQQGQPGQHSQHPGVAVPYPPNYYGGGMPMQRGPGGPQMGGYHPQMVGGPQQIPVVPGGNPYRQMYGMQQPPPQMRGPNGAPFYPNAPPHYTPHYMGGDGDDYRGGGRGGRGAARGAGRRPGGRKPGGRTGSGRGYQNWNANPRDQGMQNGGGRHPPQNTPGEDPTPADAQQQSASTEEPPAAE